MKKTFYFAMIFVAVTAFSCKKTSKKGEAEQAKTGLTEVLTDEIIDDEHSAEFALDYNGVYEGVIPAADNAAGINTTITLAFDNTFTKKTVSVGKDKSEQNEKGNFKFEDDLLGLYFENGNIEYYMVGEGHLRMLDKEKNKIEGDLSEAYVLVQTEIFDR